MGLGPRAAGVFVLLGGLMVAHAAAASDPFGEPERPTASGVPLAYVERPIITPHRSMEIYLTLPVARVAPNDPLLGFQTGVRHGLLQDLELGASLWPLVFKDGIQVSGPPSMFVTQRLPIAPWFEVGLYARLAVPLIYQSWAAELAVPVLVKAGWFRLDTGVSYTYSPGLANTRHGAVLPALLSAQLHPRWRVGLSANTAFARGPAGRHSDLGASFGLGFQVAHTIPASAGGAFVDLILDASALDVASTKDPRPPFLDSWFIGATARFYFYFGRSTFEDDHFID